MRHVSAHIGTGHLIHGTAFQQAGISFQQRCLPNSALSMAGLMVMLSTWCRPTTALGGLDTDVSRSAARALLEALIDVAFPTIDAQHQLMVLFDPRWFCKWPRPQTNPTASDVVTLPVSAHGVDLTEWQLMAQSPLQHAVAFRIWRACGLSVLPTVCPISN